MELDNMKYIKLKEAVDNKNKVYTKRLSKMTGQF